MEKEWETRALIFRAQNPNCPEEELAVLWDYPDVRVRNALALNPSTPLHVLERMASKETDWRVFFQASVHLSRRPDSAYFGIDPEVITALLRDETEATPDTLSTIRALPGCMMRAMFVVTPTRRRRHTTRHTTTPAPGDTSRRQAEGDSEPLGGLSSPGNTGNDRRQAEGDRPSDTRHDKASDSDTRHGDTTSQATATRGSDTRHDTATG